MADWLIFLHCTFNILSLPSPYSSYRDRPLQILALSLSLIRLHSSLGRNQRKFKVEKESYVLRHKAHHYQRDVITCSFVHHHLVPLVGGWDFGILQQVASSGAPWAMFSPRHVTHIMLGQVDIVERT